MASASLPPGFRFHPTDEELVGYYLKRKIEGQEFELEVIPVVDLYKFDPWELPDKSFLPQRDMEWFFFCPRDRKYPNGSRTNRATKAGYWKATGKDRRVACQSSVTGYRKTLVFYRGRAPLGDRTDWVMHEYRLCDDSSQGSQNFRGPFALCRIVKRNELSQKTSDCHGEPKSKMVGNSSSYGDCETMEVCSEPLSMSNSTYSQGSYLCNEIRYPSHMPPQHEVTQMADLNPYLTETNPASCWVSPDMILDSSKDYSQGQYTVPHNFQHQQHDFPSPMTSWQPCDHKEISPSSSYSNLAGEVELPDELNRFSCVSPYSGHGDYMEYYGDIPYGGYDNAGSLGYPKPF